MEHLNRSSRWEPFVHYALAVGVTALLMTWHLARTPLDGHEAYVGIVARTIVNADQWLDPNMAEHPVPENTPINHWLIPVCNRQERVVKTPLAYWCVALLSKLGMPLDEFTARFPSALAAVLLVVVTLALGRSMFSHRAALFGALMLGTSLAFISWGRNARADMQMCLWMTVAMWGFYRGLAQSGTRRHVLFMIAWVALGLGNLAKPIVPLFLGPGFLLYLAWRQADSRAPEETRPRRWLVIYLVGALVGFVLFAVIRIIPALHWWHSSLLSAIIPSLQQEKDSVMLESAGILITLALAVGVPIVWFLMRCKVWRQLRPFLPTLAPGLVIMLLMFVPWLLFLSHTFPETTEVLSHQTLERGLGTGGWLARSASSFKGYYLQSLAKWTVPWVAFFPGALALPFMKRFQRDRDGLTFLLLWVFGLVLLFSLAVGKHEQYILPAIPAVCLLMGCFVQDAFFEHRWVAGRLSSRFVLVAAAGMTLGMVGVLVWFFRAGADTRPQALHILVLTVLGAAPLWAGWFVVCRGQMLAALTCLLLAAVLVELGYTAREDLWTDKWNRVADFARTLSASVEAGDIRLAAWHDPDASVIWYFGRDIPVATRFREHLEKLHGVEEGKQLWRHWLEEAPPLEIVGHLPGQKKEFHDVEEMAEFGFQPTLELGGKARNWIALFTRPGTPAPSGQAN